MMKDYIKITLGPMCLMLALVAFLSQHSSPMALLGCIAVFSLPVIWRLQLKGSLYIAGLLLSSFAMLYAFHESSYYILWVFFWCLALVAALVLTALCSQQYHSDHLSQEKVRQEHLAKTSEEHRQKEQLLLQEKEETAGRAQELEEKLLKKEEHLASLKQLAIAAKEEADKYFMQCEHLNQEILTLCRQAGALEEMSCKYEQLEESHKNLLKQLNTTRVNSYQYELLAFAPQEKLIAEPEQEDVDREVEQLERERASVKSSYEKHLRDYQAIVDKLQTLLTLDELAYYTGRERSFEESYKDLKAMFQEKGKVLQELRVEIFKIEGSILQLKQTRKNVGHFPGSYLTIADQECLRLEEENAILLEIISSALPLLEKKIERPTEPLKSHSHHE